MRNHNHQEEKLKNSLKKILIKQDLTEHQDFITRLSTELRISPLDCAAALSFLNQPDLYAHDLQKERNTVSKKNIDHSRGGASKKIARYRLNIGRKHKITREDLTNVLVEVSGVDRKKIGWMDIRNHYTLVELPDGMPVDIFQLLSELEINQQRLNIKRIKFQRRFYKKNNKKKVENS